MKRLMRMCVVRLVRTYVLTSAATLWYCQAPGGGLPSARPEATSKRDMMNDTNARTTDENAHRKPCDMCKGRGKIRVLGGESSVLVDCPDCDGPSTNYKSFNDTMRDFFGSAWKG